ncbi:MAG: ATP-binding protein [Thermodesulfobacteriota bacterium]|nr:ATP-binding protein [Thermodesulfobacteriota bacterium]
MLKNLVSKLKNIHRGESPFLQRPLGLQTRITLLVAMIVVSVLVLFSYLDLRLTERSQQQLLRERAIYVIREIDSKIYSMKDLENLAFLEEEIAGWIYTRPSIKSIDIFIFHKESYKVQISSSGETDLGLTYRELQAVKHGRVLSALKEKNQQTCWEILAPLHVGRKVLGGIRIYSSLEEAEGFLAQKRTRTIFFTLTSVAILILILTLFFSRAINRPIQRLVRAMSEAEEGKLNVEVPINSRDELGLLSDHFNRMLSRISQFNEELTRRVESATRELAQRNEELRMANESLFQTQRQLVQAEKLSALGHMAATMAHEIGTPLNSISGYIQLMLTEGNYSEVMIRRLKIIESQLERLTQTIRNLLHSTRQPAPKLQALDINQLLEDVLNLTQPEMSMRGVQLVRHLDASLPPVSGDPGLLQQVFLNLMTNALDAMPKGGVLSISTYLAAAPPLNGQTIEVLVIDNGTGMPEEVKRKAIEPFFTTKEPGKGAGLGLAICDEIIRGHHGKLVVESQEGQGSTVRVQLPVFLAEVE